VAANFACNANASVVVDTTVVAEDTFTVVVVADAIAFVREATVLVVTAAKLEMVGLVAVTSGVYVVAVVVSCGIGEAHSSLQDFGTVLGNAGEQERALGSWGD